ncbi:MAG: GNAT family N-acetyltransferase [Promethearchaeota archaeon]
MIIIRQFHDEDVLEIQNFDKDFPLVVKECHGKGWIHVAIVDNTIVGYFALLKGQEPAYFDENITNWAEIREVHVHPRFQRQGIGTLLTKFALDLAKSEGFLRVYVCTDDFNQVAQKTYLNCGFRELNRIIRYRFVYNSK